jgi:hypothetical protein
MRPPCNFCRRRPPAAVESPRHWLPFCRAWASWDRRHPRPQFADDPTAAVILAHPRGATALLVPEAERHLRLLAAADLRCRTCAALELLALHLNPLARAALLAALCRALEEAHP